MFWYTIYLGIDMKITKQGQLIYDLILSSKGHMTAEEILFELKNKHLKIGIATIYRNLNALYSAGYINRVRHPELGYIYDKNKSEHYHFYDKKTKKIYDIDLNYQEELDRLVEKILGGKVESHSIIFEGTLNRDKK